MPILPVRPFSAAPSPPHASKGTNLIGMVHGSAEPRGVTLDWGSLEGVDAADLVATVALLTHPVGEPSLVVGKPAGL